jgi:DNA-binding protein H-NS
MAFEGQAQTALERLDEALAKLRTLIKRGEQQAALRFMEEGELKDRYEELQNMINISGVNPLGARGAQNTGRL